MRHASIAPALVVIAAALSAMTIPRAAVHAQTALSLEACRSLALEHSVGSANSRLEAASARLVRKSAFTAWFPTVSAGGFLFRARDPLMEMTTRGGNLPVYDGNPVNLPSAKLFAYMPGSTMGLLKDGDAGYINAVQPVFAGGRILNGNKLAALGVDVAELRTKIARNATLLATEEQYWQLASLREKRTTAGRYRDMLASLEREVNDAHASGLATKNDLLKVQLKRSEVAVTQSRIEHGITVTTMAFCRHLGIPFDSALVLTDTLATGDPPEVHRIDLHEALTRRAEFALLQASVRAEELQTRMKLGEYLPQAGVGVSGMITRFDNAEQRALAMVFGTVQIPISAWWDGAYALEARAVQEDIARNTARDGVQLLMLQMEKSWRDLEDAHAELELAAEARAQAEENLRVSSDGRANGMVTVTDLLEAQAMLQKTADGWTDAKAAYRLAVLRHLQATAR